MSYDDQYTYPCVNYERCGNTIRFTPQDEDRYKSKGLIYPDGKVRKPKRCYSCRQEFKRQRGYERH